MGAKWVSEEGGLFGRGWEEWLNIGGSDLRGVGNPGGGGLVISIRDERSAGMCLPPAQGV